MKLAIILVACVFLHFSLAAFKVLFFTFGFLKFDSYVPRDWFFLFIYASYFHLFIYFFGIRCYSSLLESSQPLYCLYLFCHILSLILDYNYTYGRISVIVSYVLDGFLKILSSVFCFSLDTFFKTCFQIL